MGKLFLSMLIGAAALLAATDDSAGRLKDGVRAAALAVAEVVRR